MEWNIHQQDQDKVKALAEVLQVSPLSAWVMLNRGIDNPDAARLYLNPTLDQLRPEPYPADTAKAVGRIETAIEKNELIGVHGDYDVDGITGAALLHLFLSGLGARSTWYLPHRQQEGYGMKPCGVDALKERGVSLILTVDCGVSDHEAIAHANRQGIEVIVVDHHQAPPELPPALAVINPSRPDCPFHDEPLSGVGVAFFLCIALRARLREKGKITNGPNLLEFLDLVALGTIADVAPLTGRNRVLTRFGLELFAKPRRPGIIQLKRVAGAKPGPVSAGQISFHMAPRLNAAGRLESAEASLQLLLAQNEREAGLIADELEKMNQRRRQVEERILEEALRALDAVPEPERGAGLVCAGEDWHIGVIGIVASRLVETYYRPACVIGVHGGMGKGSLRSIPGINIHAVLTRLAPLLETFGGHPAAAGLSIKAENIPAFAQAFPRAVAEEAPGHSFAPALTIDAEWPLHRCDRKTVAELESMKPFGMGNPGPVFCARGVEVKWSREARGNTLLMGVEENGVTLTAVGFRMSERMPGPGARLDIVYNPVLDDFSGGDKVKLMLKDFRVVA